MITQTSKKGTYGIIHDSLFRNQLFDPQRDLSQLFHGRGLFGIPVAPKVQGGELCVTEKMSVVKFTVGPWCGCNKSTCPLPQFFCVGEKNKQRWASEKGTFTHQDLLECLAIQLFLLIHN